MKAIIMAAGQGVRLWPLTDTRPKVMLPVAGRPILWHVLESVKQAGIREAVIIVRYKKEIILDYFRANDPGLQLTFVDQVPQNGTGAAILSAENQVNDTFLALAGDSLVDPLILRQVIEAHEGRKNPITMAIKDVNHPSLYGTVQLSGNTVSLFEEKAEKPKSSLANISVYCMEPGVFQDIRRIPLSPRTEQEVVGVLIGAKAVKTTAFWMDIAYPWHLFDANDHLLSKMEARAGDIENSTIRGKLIMEEGARIFDSYVEGNCFIGKGTQIGPGAILKGNVSIGAHCDIGGSTTVKNSILLDGVNAKHLSYIGDSVVGEGVNFGSGTQLANFRFDEGPVNVMTGRGWVNSGRKKLGSIIGDGTRFGVLSSVMPGKTIGANCWIGSGAIVNRNLAANTHVRVKQEWSEYVERG